MPLCAHGAATVFSPKARATGKETGATLDVYALPCLLYTSPALPLFAHSFARDGLPAFRYRLSASLLISIYYHATRGLQEENHLG